MECTRCRKYTLFPPLCAECERDEERQRDQADRPVASRESIERHVVTVAAKELEMSPAALSKKVERHGGEAYDAVLRVAHARDRNAEWLKSAIKALVALAVLYWGILPLAEWFRR